ncbi:diaminopimelate decarboxylase [Buchnera aphidicola]|uniref:Diaminopimelate decarboxylase n=1 Tax=Buchnera aphidicola subsp. Tuberolachnus salignus TaxID=98804 RepID=A0A160SW30_BUCTT|nr:diaminopimelate decarboxylase [Buchnera aphidicola]CUR53257.1 Diaminopimelate decarboxylase [Buchnera aphidicola (Tuberolachnus salignus)]
MNNIILKKKHVFFLTKTYKTPLWVYNAEIIRQQILKLKKFQIVRFAQKSCSNIHILKIIRKCGAKIDAVSIGEIERALISGFKTYSNDIVFTSDIFEKKSLKKVIKYKIPVNLGSLHMIKQLGEKSPKHPVWIRINPKFGHGHHIKTNTGGENSKHGIWNSIKALKLLKKYNLNLIGLHMHIGSGVDYLHLKKVSQAMIKEAINLNQKINFISAGGGLTIPYHEKEQEVNLNNYYKIWNKAKKKISNFLQCPITLEIEPGRFITAQSGILISKICSIKKNQKKYFVILDSGFNDLLRPVLYGSYHKITVIPGPKHIFHKKYNIDAIISGPLCESGDLFTVTKTGSLITRKFQNIACGDYLIIHDTGAYGASMSSNYNSRPLIPEILYDHKKFKLIRRRQTIQEMLSLENN